MGQRPGWAGARLLDPCDKCIAWFYRARFLYAAILLCIILMIVARVSGREIYKEWISQESAFLGEPSEIVIPIEKPGKIHKIEVWARQAPKTYKGEFDFEAAILDSDKQYLFSFEDCFWYDTGWEWDEGRHVQWAESDSDSKLLFIPKEAGDYYVRIQAIKENNPGFGVRVTEGVMLTRYFVPLIAILLVFALITSFQYESRARKQFMESIEQMSGQSSGGASSQKGK